MQAETGIGEGRGVPVGAVWAECRHSLQARGGSVTMARADIQTVTDRGAVLRCGRPL